MPKIEANLLRSLTTIAAVLTLSSCAPPYDRFMQEGQEFRKKNDFAKARESFHKAMLDAKQHNKTDKLLLALEAEIEAARMVHADEDVLRLLEQEVSIVEKKNDERKAAELRRDMALTNQSTGDFSAARENLNLAYEHMKNANQLKTELACEIQAQIGEIYCEQKDYKTALKYLEAANKTLNTAVNRDLHYQATVLHKLAFIYEELHRENEAVECEDRAKALEMNGIHTRINGLPQL